jgi:hypothetical protein
VYFYCLEDEDRWWYIKEDTFSSPWGGIKKYESEPFT